MGRVMSAIDSSRLNSIFMANQIGIAVAVKSRNVQKAQAAAVLSLLDSAMEVQQQVRGFAQNSGTKLDVRG